MHQNVRELTDHEIFSVAGGLEGDTVEPGWQHESAYGTWDSVYCGPFCGIFQDFYDWLAGDDEIVVYGYVPDGVDLGNGHELVMFNDGVRSLYVNGEWFANVKLDGIVITNGSPSAGITFGSDGGSFTYSSGDSAVYNFTILEGR
jgi:hypothetical protein